MKNHLVTGLILTFFSVSVCTAQTPVTVNEPDQHKPKIFAQMPDRIPMDAAELSDLISGNPETGKELVSKTTGKKATLLTGRVVSTAVKYGNSMRSLVVRLSGFDGATFSLTATTKEDGSVQYSGRILSFNAGDLYELQGSGNQYALVKRNFYELVNE